MRRFKSAGKDHLGAALLLVMGAGVVGLGMTYNVGTLNAMGAGFFPVVLGVLMIAVGLAIGAAATPPERTSIKVPTERDRASGPQWRGWLCIVAGIAAFVVLGDYGGLVPATFATVFLSAMGDRDNTFKTAAALAAIVTVFGIAVFHFGLSVQLPLFQWGD